MTEQGIAEHLLMLTAGGSSAAAFIAIALSVAVYAGGKRIPDDSQAAAKGLMVAGAGILAAAAALAGTAMLRTLN